MIILLSIILFPSNILNTIHRTKPKFSIIILKSPFSNVRRPCVKNKMTTVTLGEAGKDIIATPKHGTETINNTFSKTF